MVTKLIFKSMKKRALTTFLTIFAISISVSLLIGVERIRVGTKESFNNTITDIDLIVGAKGGSINLLLYSVFRMGSPTENISYDTFEYYKNREDIEFAIPISLGDSYDVFRVVGTTEDFFKHYKYGNKLPLSFYQGSFTGDMFDVTLGYNVFHEKKHKINDPIILSHGISDGYSIENHDNLPFKVTGVLAQTGTPVDNSVYISLKGMEAIHIGWEDGAKNSDVDATKKIDDIQIKEITAFFMKAKSRMNALYLQREISDSKREPLMAILPGVALSELWSGIGYAENSLRIISIFVVLVGLISMLIAIYNSLNERRREIAILRSLGGTPSMIFLLLVGESLCLTFMGSLIGLAFIDLVLWGFNSVFSSSFGLNLGVKILTITEFYYLVGVFVSGLILGLIPALRAYKNTLSDGLTIKI